MTKDKYETVSTDTFCDRIHQCWQCGWFREVTINLVLLGVRRWHPLWGYVTPREAAKMDVRAHRCVYSVESRRRAHA